MWKKLVILLLGIACCRGEESLPTRLQALINSADVNGDFQVTPTEDQNLIKSFDINKDGCTTKSEFSQAFSARGFTKGYSYAFFEKVLYLNGGPTGSCSGLPAGSGMKKQMRSIQVLNFAIQNLVDFCESDLTNYLKNKDCRQLPLGCIATTIGCTFACENLMFNISRDRTSFPFDNTIQPTEFANRQNLEDLYDALFDAVAPISSPTQSPSANTPPPRRAQSYRDTVGDGCWHQFEFVGLMVLPQCGGFGFTLEHSAYRWYDIAMARKTRINDTGCLGDYPLILKGTKFGASGPIAFREHNIQSTISMCEQDRRRYKTNRDCRQIFRVCTQTNHRTNEACKEYVEKVFLGEAGYSFSA